MKSVTKLLKKMKLFTVLSLAERGEIWSPASTSPKYEKFGTKIDICKLIISFNELQCSQANRQTVSSYSDYEPNRHLSTMVST